MTIPVTSRLNGALERLVAALTDPARRERAMAAVLAAYALVWTLYGVLAKGSQGLHVDMTELVAWAREPALGYFKHPPLAAFVVKAWFAIFPLTEASYYLFAMTSAALTLWIAWRLFSHYLDGEKRVIGVALLMLIPFFNFHALKFNVNTVLVPLWAVTTLWFLRSFETRSALYAALAGLGAAATMYGKYWSIFLLAGLGIAALLDSRRAAYFRSPAPWITAAVGLLLVAPHLVWLWQNNFAPLTVAVSIHGEKTIVTSIVATLGYLAGAVGYVTLPLLLTQALLRPSAAAWRDALFPPTPERQLAARAFWAPLLVPAAVAPFVGVSLVSLWTMSCWTLLPVVVLSSPLLGANRVAAMRVVAVALGLPIVMVILAPAIAVAIHLAGTNPSASQAELLTQAVEQVWHDTTGKPLRLVGGQADLAFGVAFYAPERPSAFPDFSPNLAPWVTPERIAREGIALVCAIGDPGCVSNAEALAKAGPPGRRSEVTLQRSHLGLRGESARYLIVTVPPRE
jgi:4-amino-4-deoxy-L-arabinose transferase-like glycosyltransferase